MWRSHASHAVWKMTHCCIWCPLFMCTSAAIEPQASSVWLLHPDTAWLLAESDLWPLLSLLESAGFHFLPGDTQRSSQFKLRAGVCVCVCLQSQPGEQQVSQSLKFSPLSCCLCVCVRVCMCEFDTWQQFLIIHQTQHQFKKKKEAQ